MANTDNLQHPVILFDGVCNYCNSMVNVAIKWNRKANLRFAPLQSEIGISLKAKYGVANHVDSVVFIEANKAYIESSAALRICRQLSLPFNLLYVFIVIPSFIRDAAYRWVARNRYRWFGKKDHCMVPTKEVKGRFLR